MKGKIIVIEGTDCSGKETQSNILIEKFNSAGHSGLDSESSQKMVKLSFPMYDTPTGRIVGGPYLGKSQIMEGWFEEGAPAVDPKVASLYYAADRLYNLPKIQKMLDSGVNVLLDRYAWSNFAHQGGKITGDTERNAMYNFLEKLEFDLLGLPRPDVTVFLHMPYEAALTLKANRTEEKADQHEADPEHLKHAEKTYLELAEKYGFETIECADGDKPKSIDEIAGYVYEIVRKKLTK